MTVTVHSIIDKTADLHSLITRSGSTGLIAPTSTSVDNYAIWILKTSTI